MLLIRVQIGLITSTGFRDVHVIRRPNREDLFALEPTQFPSLVSEDYVYEIEIRPRAREASPTLSAALLTSFLDGLPDDFTKLDAVVISLIHGYAHQDLEAQIANAVAERFPGVTAYSAAKLVPFSREYERVETAPASLPTITSLLSASSSFGHRPMGHYGVLWWLVTLEEAMEEPVELPSTHWWCAAACRSFEP